MSVFIAMLGWAFGRSTVSLLEPSMGVAASASALIGVVGGATGPHPAAGPFRGPAEIAVWRGASFQCSGVFRHFELGELNLFIAMNGGLRMTLMTKGGYARHRGVGKSAVSNWAKKDLLVMAECPTSGSIMVDVERTDARINARVDPMRGRPSGQLPLVSPAPGVEEGGDPRISGRSVALVRAELAEEQLISVRLKNAENARELAARVELERRAAEMGRVARERMHAMWRAVAERLAAERDVRTVMSIGVAEIDRVFAQLADDVDHGRLVQDEATPEEAAIERQVEAQLAEE